MKLALTQSALAGWPLAPRAIVEAIPSAVTLRNSHFELECSLSNGLRCRLVHLETGTILADSAYSYSFGSPVFSDVQQDSSSLVFQGATETGLAVRHRFAIHPSTPLIEEEIELTNQSSSPFDLHDLRTGFMLPVPLGSAGAEGPSAKFEFTAVPFRREPAGHKMQYADFSLNQILTQQFSSELWPGDTSVTAAYAAEGWAWSDGNMDFSFRNTAPTVWSFPFSTASPCRKTALRCAGVESAFIAERPSMARGCCLANLIASE